MPGVRRLQIASVGIITLVILAGILYVRPLTTHSPDNPSGQPQPALTPTLIEPEVTDDAVIIMRTAHLEGTIDGSEGIDTYINEGFIDGDIRSSGGADVIVNRHTINDDILGEAGSDTIANYGLVAGDIRGGNEADTIVNYGSVEATVLGNGGDDAITNYGTVTMDIRGDEGDDVIVNRGVAQDDIWGGPGDDLIIVEAGAPVASILSGGNGIDELVFLFKTLPDVSAAQRQLALLEADNGSFVFNGHVYSWLGFESLAAELDK